MSWIIALHVIGSVFIIGPLAVLPMTGLRAIREGGSAQVRGLSRTVMMLGWLTVLVGAFGVVGFYVMNPAYRNKLGTAWLVWSVVLTLIALVLTLAVVVPHMNAAAKAIESRKASTAAAFDSEVSRSGSSGKPGISAVSGSDTAAAHRQYVVVSAVSGIVSLLFVAVAVLMVIR
ncbi:DUF2269 family protein [Bifidobacterium sp.]|jgi:uncharacterized membrane protein|uniref:DUF2269 family protein n=1 Tax=Bifidobacterium sp. TaxID=41200 RepID=UPI0025C66D88|nr:DUF2269 family protein [Bifidobacterium sp.]MCH4209720.1 DUF2269 domain-containing protein [Bifidobacterium sp.]MCI1224510.1 DUF2269 domain-containing protein [Bifidobacterium sp.]